MPLKNIKLQNYILVRPNALLRQYSITFYIIFSQPWFSFKKYNIQFILLSHSFRFFRCRNSHIKCKVHNINIHLLPDTYSWVVINKDTMQNIKIKVLQVMRPCNLIGVLRLLSRYTAFTFRWPVKITSKLLQITQNNVLDYTVS